jgi:3-hydroxyisobutyrate dehydrogenase-like beta-hydroxyacid dehydrogenase
MAELGYVGLGVMGGGVVRRLLDAGHAVTVWNRTAEKADPLLEVGARWADSPREVAERSEITFTMVTNTAAVTAVAEGPDGILAGLAPGKVYVDMSTASPANTRELAEKVAAVGASMVDAPVSGSVITLEQGKLSIMVGGDAEVFERVKPVLEAIGPRVFHLGPNGAAVTMKIAINLSLAVQMLAFSEGVLLAEKSGIPREKAVEVMLASVIASPMVAYRGPFVLEQPEEAWFDCHMMQKDLNLALELGRELEVPLPTTRTGISARTRSSAARRESRPAPRSRRSGAAPTRLRRASSAKGRSARGSSTR